MTITSTLNVGRWPRIFLSTFIYWNTLKCHVGQKLHFTCWKYLIKLCGENGGRMKKIKQTERKLKSKEKVKISHNRAHFVLASNKSKRKLRFSVRNNNNNKIMLGFFPALFVVSNRSFFKESQTVKTIWDRQRNIPRFYKYTEIQCIFKCRRN